MPVASSEIKTFRSVNVSDGPANGGIMSAVEAITGVSANVFSNASAMDRANGAVVYRKLFFKVANALNSPLISPRIWQESNTVGQDMVVFMPASQRGTQGGITGVEPLYGLGLLYSGAILGATSLVVEVEDGSVPIFAKNRLIRISNKANPMAAGDEVWAKISADPVVVGNLVTLTIDTALPVGFLAGSKVSSVYEPGTIQASITAPSPSSVSGAIASSWSDKVAVDGRGCIEQNWLLTFTSATAFDISGDTVGVVGSGNVTSGASPNNAAIGSPYFTLLASLFSGTFAPGDTVTFTTHPAATAIFLRRTIPMGTVAVSGNNTSLYIDGETS